MPDELIDQDWDFRALWRRTAERIAACWYEFARESRHIRIAMKEWWLRLEKPRAELLKRAKKQNIEPKDLDRAFLYYWQGVRWERHAVERHEPGYKPDWPQSLRESLERDNPAAVKLLSAL